MFGWNHALAIIGFAAAGLAALAWAGDQRRMRRTNLDRVGLMPWTTIFCCAMVVACVFLGLAARSAFTD